MRQENKQGQKATQTMVFAIIVSHAHGFGQAESSALGRASPDYLDPHTVGRVEKGCRHLIF
jgi:hypothetical protein